MIWIFGITANCTNQVWVKHLKNGFWLWDRWKSIHKDIFLVDYFYPKLSYENTFSSCVIFLIQICKMAGVGKEKYWMSSWRAFQIYKSMQTVRLHFVDDMFNVVKLCICSYNAMVFHCTKNREYTETEDMYDATIHNDNIVESSE